MRAGCPGTDGRSRPTHSLRPSSGAACSARLGPCLPITLSAGQKAALGDLHPLCAGCRGVRMPHPGFPAPRAGVLLCRGPGRTRLGAPWVLQVPSHGTDQQLLQPAGRLGHAGGAGERHWAGSGAPAVLVGFGGAVGARTFSLLSAHRVWRALGSATGPTAPSCARGCVTWGSSSS